MARTLVQWLAYMPFELFMLIMNAYLALFPGHATVSVALLELYRLVASLPAKNELRKRVLAALFEKTSFIIDKNNIVNFEKSYGSFIRGLEKVTIDLRLYMCSPLTCVQGTQVNCVCQRMRTMISSPLPSTHLQHFASLKHLTIELLNIRTDYDLWTPLIRHLVSASSQLRGITLKLQIVASARIGSMAAINQLHRLETDELFYNMNRLFKGPIRGEKKQYFGFMKTLNHTTFSCLYGPSESKHQYEEADEDWIWKAKPGRVLEVRDEGDTTYDDDDDMYDYLENDDEDYMDDKE